MKLIIVIFHVAACASLILIVLLQKGKGASMGAAFGGSSQTVFGSGGAASFLQKLTTAVAILFMVTSLTLAFMFGRGATSSIMEGVTQPEIPVAQETQDAAPAPTGAQPTQGSTPAGAQEK